MIDIIWANFVCDAPNLPSPFPLWFISPAPPALGHPLHVYVVIAVLLIPWWLAPPFLAVMMAIIVAIVLLPVLGVPIPVTPCFHPMSSCLWQWLGVLWWW